jgi:hypothetical protein
MPAFDPNRSFAHALSCKCQSHNSLAVRLFDLAKNDPLDARVIATFVAIMPTQPAQPRPPAIERLAEMLAIRRRLSAEKVAAENASARLEDASRSGLRFVAARP